MTADVVGSTLDPEVFDIFIPAQEVSNLGDVPVSWYKTATRATWQVWHCGSQSHIHYTRTLEVRELLLICSSMSIAAHAKLRSTQRCVLVYLVGASISARKFDLVVASQVGRQIVADNF